MQKQQRKLRPRGTVDGGLSWFIALGSFMTQFVVMGIHNVFGLLYIDLLKDFGESKATTGENLNRVTTKSDQNAIHLCNIDA